MYNTFLILIMFYVQIDDREYYYMYYETVEHLRDVLLILAMC